MRPDEWKAAVPAIPDLGPGDIDAALNAAGRSLNNEMRADLCNKLTAALHCYVRDRLLIAQRVPASKLRPRLKQIIKSTEALCETKGIRPILANAAENLRDLAKHELGMQEARIARQEARVSKQRPGRHEGNKPLRHFFGGLNDIWSECFQKLPGATWNAHEGELGGAFINFTESILHAYAARIPDELDRLAPGLRKGLRLSRPAIHGYFRRTSISPSRRIAKSILD